MDDRQSKYPGRVKLRDVETGAEKTYDLTMADEPLVEGDPPTKRNLLQDTTCDVLGISRTSVPNDAFLKLALGVGKYGYMLRVVLPNGKPVPGAKVVGAESTTGCESVTDSDGYAVVVSEKTSVTLGVESPYIDMQSAQSVSISSEGTLTRKQVTLQAITAQYLTVETSGIYKHSGYFSTIDFFLSAAGGGGGSSKSKGEQGGGGGAAGNAKNVMGFQTGYKPGSFTITIGAAGKGGTEIHPSGSNGGGTSITNTDTGDVIGSVSGGAGGQVAPANTQKKSNNGNGGLAPTPGGDASVNAFNDSSIGKKAGGGGGGGNYDSNEDHLKAGAPFGGNGGDPALGSRHGKNATGYGGGGGGACQNTRSESITMYKGGDGYNGVVLARFNP